MKTPEEVLEDATKGRRIYWAAEDLLNALDRAGYTIVPKRATRPMTIAAENMGAGEAWAEDCWSAMLAAKP